MKRSKLDRREQGRWMPLLRMRDIQRTAEQREKIIAASMAMRPDLTRDQVAAILDQAEDELRETWGNDRYLVHVIHWQPLHINGTECPIVQLSIRRLDRGPTRDWRDFQRIKNQLVGPECEAIELYPAESRLVDTANQFHLWCVADPEFRFPFGYSERLVSGESSGAGDVQRPFDDEEITT